MLPRALHSFPTRRSSDLCSGIGSPEWIGQHRAIEEFVLTHPWFRVHREVAGLLGTWHARTKWSRCGPALRLGIDRKSTRLNSSHEWISYAVFCLKKKKIK